jgi:hypothetical protein
MSVTNNVSCRQLEAIYSYGTGLTARQGIIISLVTMESFGGDHVSTGKADSGTHSLFASEVTMSTHHKTPVSMGKGYYKVGSTALTVRECDTVQHCHCAIPKVANEFCVLSALL